MSSSNPNAGPRGIPEGFRAVAIHGGAVEGSLRACVVVRLKSDPISGRFVVLRELPIGTVYLGCLVDAAGALWDWIEVWVQKVREVGLDIVIFPSQGNGTFDDLWNREIEALDDVAPEDSLHTGWERAHPPPLFMDDRHWSPVHPVDAVTGKPWRLCRDGTRLGLHGLPAYRESRHRYLEIEGATGDVVRFVATSSEDPVNESVLHYRDVLSDSERMVPFNPEAGLLAVRRFYPLDLEDYVDLLGGKPWPRPGRVGLPFGFGGLCGADAGPEPGQPCEPQLYMGPPKLGNRLVEALYLKLRVLADAFGLVRTFVARCQRPFFNLSPDSFRVHVEALGRGLPILWSARLALVKPGQAVALPIETTGLKRFLPFSTRTRSVYLPEMLGAIQQTKAELRIRNVSTAEGGTARIEGTLVVRELSAPGPNDLGCVGLVLHGRPVRLYGRLLSIEPAAPGELRFQGWPQALDAADLASLRAVQGVPQSKVWLEIVPALGAACDLYSLAVLAVRILLVNDGTTLPVALDEVLSLARQVAVSHEAKSHLAHRIQREFEVNPRWQAALGPHRLLDGKVEGTDAANLLPSLLWCRVLAALVPLFPGSGPDSHCRDFGDAPALAPESVFDAPGEAFRELMRLTRSLIVTDWEIHREVHAAIEVCRGRLTT